MRFPLLLALTLATSLSTSAQPIQIKRLHRLDCSACVNPGGVYITSRGDRVFLLDGGSPHVRVYTNGTQTTSFGRTGAGPGEFRGPYFVATNRAGEIAVVDVLTRQLSWLAADGTLRQRVMLPAFPSNVTQVAGGEDLLFVWNDFRGTHTAQLWTFGSSTPGRAVVLPKSDDLGTPYPVAQRSNGSWALIPDYKTYRIMRRAADGSELPALNRDIPRTRRTLEEESSLRDRMARGAGKSREEGARSKAPRSLLPPGTETSLKPHFFGAAIQYDDDGRLWVLTGRGNEKKTVFDVFDANDKFAGSVEVPFATISFSLGGGRLALAGTDEEGLPVLEVWEVVRR